jgi:predicted RNA-binding protein with PIN domain
MYYLIDGYNFLFRISEISHHRLQEQRNKVISSLQRKFAALGLKGKIVFDAHQGEVRSRSYKSPLVIAYAAKGETADHYILEYLEGIITPGEVTVVTDDRSLSSAARKLGAKTSNVSTFYTMLHKKHAHKEPKKKVHKESKWEVHRLLKQFERSFFDDSTTQ